MSSQSDNARVSKSLPSAVGCDGKVSFDSFKLANAVVTRHPRDDGRRCRIAYRCGHCGAWHIGSNKGGHAKRKESAQRNKRHE